MMHDLWRDQQEVDTAAARSVEARSTGAGCGGARSGEAPLREVGYDDELLGAVASSYSVSRHSDEALEIGDWTARAVDIPEGEDICSVAAMWRTGMVLDEIRSEMRRCGMSTASLAAELGLGVAATKSLLKGRGKVVDLEMLHRMAAAVGKTLTLSLF